MLIVFNLNSFISILGGQHLEERVPNIDLIKRLCYEHQNELAMGSGAPPPTRPITLTEIHRSYPIQVS